MPITKAVLIIGGSGFIGTHLAIRLRTSCKVYATFQSHPMRIPGVTFLPLNLENRNWVKRVIYTARPDVIVYAAGRNDFRWAEDNPRMAEYIHASGAASIATVAEIFQPMFLYLSNAYAFDGQIGNYRESDLVLASSALGKVKYGGENMIKGKAYNYVILRSSPVFGRGNGYNLSFVDRIRMTLDRGSPVELSNDELHAFAPVDGLIELIGKIIESNMRSRILHYGGLTKATYYEFGRNFAKRFGYNPALIIPAASRYRGQVLDYSLNSSEAAQTLKIKPLLLEQSLDLIQKNLIARA